MATYRGDGCSPEAINNDGDDSANNDDAEKIGLQSTNGYIIYHILCYSKAVVKYVSKLYFLLINVTNTSLRILNAFNLNYFQAKNL